MNFGNWIVVAFVVFAVFIATLVTVCFRQDISLVSRDYYKQEIAYQDQIQRLNNTAELTEKPFIKIVGHNLQLEFCQFDKIEQGELKLFCPSNEKMDVRFIIKSQRQHVQFFNLTDLNKGMYRARLRWRMNGKEFYHEQIINI